MAGVPVVITTEMAVDLWKGKSERFVDRRLARWCDRLVGNSQAVVDYYRSLGVPEDRLAMIYSGIAEEEPPPVDPAALARGIRLRGRLRRWSSSPAAWPSRSGSTTCSRRSTCSSTCSPTFAP